MNLLSNKVAIVTGGSRGIGRSICIALAGDGAKVLVNYTSNSKAADEVVGVIKEKGGEAVTFQADVSDHKQVEKMVVFTLDRFGKIDILVNNAGIMTDSLVVDMSQEEWDRVVNINLKGVFNCSKEVLKSMITQKSGRIVNVSSQAAKRGSVRHAHYAAAKSGISGFSYSLAKEVAPYGITVNMVSPGRIKTDIVIPSIKKKGREWLKQTPLGRFGEPEEVAEAVLFLVSNDAGYITGETINVNGGLLMD